MESHISLTGLLVAALMFAVTVAMHEAARADGQTGSDYRGNSQWVCSFCAAAQGGTRLRANFLSIPDSIHSGSPKGPRSIKR